MVDISDHQRPSSKFNHENELKEPLLCKVDEEGQITSTIEGKSSEEKM